MTVRDFLADPNHGLYPPGGADVADLPEVAPAHHPTPWAWRSSGNGKGWIVDAAGREVVPLYLWDHTAIEKLGAKLALVNAGPGGA
jgi:hypothetical protein